MLGSVFMFGITALAGNINAHEQRVLDEVSTPVVYEGKEYVAKEEYVTRLAMYMNQDNVDLTAEQADLAIQKFIDNVATGIAEGYMEEVNSGSGNGGTSSGGGGTSSGGNDTTEDSSQNKDENNSSSSNDGGDEINGTEISTDNALVPEGELSEEEIAKLQRERALVEAVMEKYSLEEEEADVYAELEAIESSMEELESTTEEPESTTEEHSTVEAKDYSDAEPFQKGISVGMIAIVIVVIVAVAMVILIIWHKNKRLRR